MANRIRIDVPLNIVSDGVTASWSLSINTAIYGGNIPGTVESVSLLKSDANYITAVLNPGHTQVIFTWVGTIPINGFVQPMILLFISVV